MSNVIELPQRSGGPSPERVAEEIRVQMARRQVKQSELTRRTGIKQATLSRRLSGDEELKVAELLVIAAALGVNASEILGAAERDASGPPPWGPESEPPAGIEPATYSLEADHSKAERCTIYRLPAAPLPAERKVA